MGAFTFILMQQTKAAEMTPAGWAFLIIAWTAITVVTVWCFSKILRKK